MVGGTILPSQQLKVQKRGFVSGVTVGEITTVATNGSTGVVIPRFYKNAIVVTSTTTGPGETTFAHSSCRETRVGPRQFGTELSK